MPKILLTLSKKIYLILVIFWLVVIGVLIAVYIGTNRSASQALLNEALERQLSTTKTASAAIREFILLSGRSLVLLADNYQDINNQDEQLAYLDRFVAYRKDTPIVGVAVTDRQGKVIQNATSNGTREMVGVDLSDREGVIWSRRAQPGEYFVSQPVISRLGTSKGKTIISLTSPLFKNNTYQGAIVAAIVLEKFEETYLNVFTIEDSQVYLLNSNGEILVGNHDPDVGHNVLQLIDATPFPGSDTLKLYIAELLNTRQPGSLDLLLPINGKLTRTLATYAPITIDSQSWILGVITPARSLLTYVAPIYIQQLTIIITFFFLLLFLVLALMRMIKIKN